MKYFLFLCSAIFSCHSYAQTAYCNGYDATGYAIYFIGSSDSNTVNINGDILRVVGKTRDGTGVVTETFIATNGVLVYDSLVPVTSNTLSIYQFNAITNKLLAFASLNCKFSGISKTASLFDHKSFSALKSENRFIK